MRTKRYDGEDGSDVSSDITPKRVNINNPDSYKVPMPMSEDDMAESEINRQMGKDYDTENRNETNESPQTLSKRKSPVVTKEQLEKSGLSLRDYMNKQKGLTRKEPEEMKKRGFTGSETGGGAAIMYRKKMATGGKAFAKGGSIKEARMQPSKMEKGGDLKKGNLPRGEHAIQQRGHTRAMMPKMAGNDIGTKSPKRK